jgi:hypothetical protein
MKAIDKSDRITHIESMETTKPVLKPRQPVFIPGRGTVEAESIEEAIKTSDKDNEEVKHGDK